MESKSETTSYPEIKSKVDQAIDKAWNEEQTELKKVIWEVVEDKMKKGKVLEGELDSEEKNLYTKFKNKQHTDKDQFHGLLLEVLFEEIKQRGRGNGGQPGGDDL